MLPGLGHGIKPLGQIRDSYIVATDEEGLLLVDQHVAHERILFEQFRDGRLARSAGLQPLLIPATLDLTIHGRETTYQCIYKLEGDRLTILLQNFPGKHGRPRDFDAVPDHTVRDLVEVHAMLRRLT